MSFGRAVYEVARNEFMQHLRTKRLLIIGTLLVASIVFLTLLIGVGLIDNLVQDEETVTATEHLVLLFYFSTFFVGGYFFIQLLAIVLTADAVCSEWANKTVFLVLSKPVSRVAFVTGKFLGSIFTVAATIVVLFTLDYVALNIMVSGGPTPREVAGFFLALAVLILGAAAFTALSLFFSTLTRNTVVSLLLTLGLWIIVFPLIGQIGFFSALGDPNWEGDFDAPQIDAWRYVNPGADMGVAGRFIVLDDDEAAVFEFLSPPPKHTGLALLALAGHTTLYFGASLLVVQRRNFE